jgi:hypothetical protein
MSVKPMSHKDAEVEGRMSDTIDANIRLIAAAPELLAALKLCERLLSAASAAGGLYGRHDVEWGQVESGVRSVIAEAEGRDE